MLSTIFDPTVYEYVTTVPCHCDRFESRYSDQHK
jgi:hypothetical protein